MTRLLGWLRQVPTTYYLVLVLGVGVIGVYQGWAYHQREVGKRDLLIAQHEQTNADLRHVADSLGKVYRTDTLRLTKFKRVTDSLTVTVDRWKHDTLRVVEYVEKADSTIKVCTAALSTCEARVGVATRGWDNARKEIATLKASYPSKAKPWLYGALGVGAGYLAGRLQR